MKKLIASCIATAALILCVVAPARATDHTKPGVPGTPTCHGETIAFLAQAGAEGNGDAVYHGIGGLGHLIDKSVAEVQATVDQFCSQTIP